MGLGRVVERRPLPEARRLSLTLTPGARDPHAGSLAGRGRARSRARMVVSRGCISRAGASSVAEGRGDVVANSQGLARHGEKRARRFGKVEQFMARVFGHTATLVAERATLGAAGARVRAATR